MARVGGSHFRRRTLDHSDHRHDPLRRANHPSARVLTASVPPDEQLGTEPKICDWARSANRPAARRLSVSTWDYFGFGVLCNASNGPGSVTRATLDCDHVSRPSPPQEEALDGLDEPGGVCGSVPSRLVGSEEVVG